MGRCRRRAGVACALRLSGVAGSELKLSNDIMPRLRHRSSGSPRRPTRRRRQDKRSDWPQFVTTITSIASVLLVAIGLFYTNDQNRKQQELAERGQVTDRFTKAIDQLGSDKLDVRLGGIYALERLMRDSVEDRRNIVEVLSTYVREHAPRTGATRARVATPSPTALDPRERRLATDVQAALTVLARRPIEIGNILQVVDLSGTGLAGADLESAQLNNASLARSDLSGTNLAGADFGSADLRGTSLAGANLLLADLSSADLEEADLKGASLVAAKFNAANLAGVDLTGANLDRVDLTTADLWAADLTFAKLDNANLTNAKLGGAKLRCISYNQETAWPAGIVLSTPWYADPECLKEKTAWAASPSPSR